MKDFHQCIEVIGGEFSVCKVRSAAGVPLEPYTFLSVTNSEVSLVCRTGSVPSGANFIDSGWRMFRIKGVIDFALVGVIADIADILKRARISLFVVSTYDTDYVLVKLMQYQKAMDALALAGYVIENDEG